MRQSGVGRVVLSLWLFSLCGLTLGCESNPPIEQDAGRDDTSDATIKCRIDSDCPSDDPCKKNLCSRSGFCSTVSLPDGTDCTAGSVRPRICQDGTCQISLCGDAFIDRSAGESCEDGNRDPTDGCVSCRVAFCGDGFVQRGVEECDPWNDVYCSADCGPIVCGDGVIDEPIENCEPDTSEDPCNEQCRISDTPEWMVGSPPEPKQTIFSRLLLDSSGSLIVVASGGETIETMRSSVGTHIYKYQNDGDQSWAVEFENEVAVSAALDDEDNIIVAGGTAAEPQPWMAKIDPDGEHLWSLSTGEPRRIFYGVATDDEANIVALAISAATPSLDQYVICQGAAASLEFISADGDYNSNSATNVEGCYNISGQALSSGTIGGVRRCLVAGMVESEGSYETLLTLVESGGEPVWDKPINYGVSNERAGFVQAVATSDEDIIVLGVSYPELTGVSSVDSPDNPFFWLERYSPEGEPRWDERKRLRVEDPLALVVKGISAILPFAMAIDGQDNIYIGAHNSEQNNIEEFIIDKYDPDGESVWKRPLRHDSTSRQFPIGLAVDGSGAIYLLAGESTDETLPTPLVSFRYLLYKWKQPD